MAKAANEHNKVKLMSKTTKKRKRKSDKSRAHARINIGTN